MVFEFFVVVVDLEEDLFVIVDNGSKIVLSVGIVGFREGVETPDLLKDFRLFNRRKLLNTACHDNLAALTGEPKGVVLITNSGFLVIFVWMGQSCSPWTS